MLDEVDIQFLKLADGFNSVIHSFIHFISAARPKRCKETYVKLHNKKTK